MDICLFIKTTQPAHFPVNYYLGLFKARINRYTRSSCSILAHIITYQVSAQILLKERSVFVKKTELKSL